MNETTSTGKIKVDEQTGKVWVEGGVAGVYRFYYIACTSGAGDGLDNNDSTFD